MKRQLLIQKFIASLLLLVFAISITPKAYFHDVIARHKDEVVCNHPQKSSACLHKQGFSCHFDDLVVTAPFLLGKTCFSFVVISGLIDKFEIYNSSCTFYSRSQKRGRAPPAA